MTKVKSFPYEASLKAKWDTQNAFETIRKEERARAEQEKHKVLIDSAKSLKETGLLSNEQIAKSLKLPLEVVEKL